MSKATSFLPKDALPRLPFMPADERVEWLDAAGDGRENYVRRGGHPVFGEHDITYSFNSLGYRSVAFDTAADIRILTIGCSYAMGVGLPQKDLFQEVFAERLRLRTGKSVAVLNLSAPGGSNDYVARLLHLAVPVLNPEITLVSFTHPGRREYVSVQDELLTYVPAYRPGDRVARNIYKHFASLTSPPDDDLNLFRNYKSVEALLGERAWLFSIINAVDFERIGAHIARARYVGAMPQLDRARDGCHPGPESHRTLAERYWERFVANDYLSR